MLTFAAVGKVFKITYDREGDPKKGTSIKEIPGGLKIQGPAPVGVLQKWMVVYSKAVFDPWLRKVAERIGRHNWKKLITRFKKTSWGSCSESGTISLNAVLLFLPPKVAESVMIHELCHTVHPKHTKEFWTDVYAADPNYKEHDKIIMAFEKSAKGSWFGGIVASPND